MWVLSHQLYFARIALWFWNHSLFSLKGKMNMIIVGGWFPHSSSGASALNGPSDGMAFSERQNKITYENLPWDLILCGCVYVCVCVWGETQYNQAWLSVWITPIRTHRQSMAEGHFLKQSDVSGMFFYFTPNFYLQQAHCEYLHTLSS